MKQLEDEFNSIAPSLRGWGQSSKPSRSNAYRILDHAADIDGLIQGFRTQQPHLFAHGIILVGHSMGGKIAQLLLASLADYSLVKGLVLVAPAPSGGFALPEDMREQQVHAYDNNDSATFVMENVLLGKPDKVDQNMLAEDATSGSPEAKAAWPAYGMAEDHEHTVVAALKRYSHEAQIPRILVVAGELDRVETPENIEKRVSKVLSDAGASVQTVTLQDVGHLIPVEAPELLSQAVSRFAEMA